MDEAPHNILLVEDDVDLAVLTARELRRLVGDEHVIHARHGVEAVAWLEQFQPSLLITDLQMPVMDGIELLKWVRSNREARFPIIVFSGSDNTKARECCRELQVDAFVEKNLGFDALLESCRPLLGVSSVLESH